MTGKEQLRLCEEHFFGYVEYRMIGTVIDRFFKSNTFDPESIDIRLTHTYRETEDEENRFQMGLELEVSGVHWEREIDSASGKIRAREVSDD